MPDWFATLYQVSAGDLAGLSAASIFTALFLATFISEDGACIAAGALTAIGEISLTLAIASCFTGIVVGDLSLYWIGRIFGRKIAVTKLGGRFVSESSLARASAWLEQRGSSAVFFSRFVTGLRLPTNLAAGFLETSFSRFALYFVLAAAVWTPILVGSIAYSGRLSGGGVIVAAIAVFVAIRITMKLGSRRNWRIFLGRLKRIVKWEFWPVPIFYLPVVCYILFLAMRHRSLTIFTCANPSFPAGGFVGESKHEIYSMLAEVGANRPFLLPHCVVQGGRSFEERLTGASDFLASNELTFPIVLKPDAGERGKGVRIIGSMAELENALAVIQRDHILQEFFDGDEVSIFYYRYPSAARGKIYSITRKVFPTVTGDGMSDLGSLILRDPRAVCLAEKYFEENADILGSVPATGERVPIIRIGTHSRGAIFLDGSDIKTAELDDAIDGICQPIGGFNFGRFDIRFSSFEEFRRGRGFRIIELNGVTSESTNIYDPRYSIRDAYRILFRQWRIAFEIGAENRRLGASKTSVRSLISAVLANSVGN